jgi:predicted ATPase
MVITIGNYRFPITYVLKLKNIGIIKEACIEFGGLTVIAGENDTGKSTIGKLLFSLIKSISRYEEDLELGDKEKIRIVYDSIRDVYFALRKTNNDKVIEKIQEIKWKKNKLAHSKAGLEYIENEILPDLEELYHIIKSSLDENMEFRGVSIDEFIKSHIDKIKEIIKKEESKENLIKRAFRRIVSSEFNSDVSNKFCNENSIIEIYSGNNKIFEFTLEGNELKSIVLNEDELYYNDAIYVESPIVLHIHHAIKYSDVSFGLSSRRLFGGIVPFHLKDLIRKLEIGGNKDMSDLSEEEYYNNLSKLNDEIYSIINGDVIYSYKSSDFEYIKYINNERYNIKSINTATGIKSFGIIQLLIKSGFLNDKTILIIDEPEVHLHPEWQLKYAEIIVKLVKYGVPVIISSHSPYMIQALRYYAMKEEIDDIAKFYLAEKDEDGLVKIKDVTDDLNQIFQKLAKPLGKVM